jgi:hypothetical protein
MENSKIKNSLMGIMIAVIFIACEGKSDPMVDNYGLDQKEMDKTRAKIDSMPSAIRRDYLKSDSLIHQDLKKEIMELKKEIASLKEELKAKKR